VRSTGASVWALASGSAQRVRLPVTFTASAMSPMLTTSAIYPMLTTGLLLRVAFSMLRTAALISGSVTTDNMSSAINNFSFPATTTVDNLWPWTAVRSCDRASLNRRL
jgi:hypothetical protein